VPRKAMPDFHHQVQQLCKEADRYSTFVLKRPVVYCIQSGEAGWFKIGKAVSIVSQLTQLQTGNPEPLQLCGLIVHRSIEGAVAHETVCTTRQTIAGGWVTGFG